VEGHDYHPTSQAEILLWCYPAELEKKEAERNFRAFYSCSEQPEQIMLILGDLSMHFI
jgi:hypothetical protein